MRLKAITQAGRPDDAASHDLATTPGFAAAIRTPAATAHAALQRNDAGIRTNCAARPEAPPTGVPSRQRPGHRPAEAENDRRPDRADC